MELFILLYKLGEDRGRPPFLWRIVLIVILILVSALRVFTWRVSKVLRDFDLKRIHIFWRLTEDVTIIEEPADR